VIEKLSGSELEQEQVDVEAVAKGAVDSGLSANKISDIMTRLLAAATRPPSTYRKPRPTQLDNADVVQGVINRIMAAREDLRSEAVEKPPEPPPIPSPKPETSLVPFVTPAPKYPLVPHVSSNLAKPFGGLAESGSSRMPTSSFTPRVVIITPEQISGGAGGGGGGIPIGSGSGPRPPSAPPIPPDALGKPSIFDRPIPVLIVGPKPLPVLISGHAPGESPEQRRHQRKGRGGRGSRTAKANASFWAAIKNSAIGRSRLGIGIRGMVDVVRGGHAAGRAIGGAVGGAGGRLATLGGGAGAAVGIVGALAIGLLKLKDAIADVTDEAMKGAAQYKDVSSQIAGVFGQREMQDLLRNIRHGEAIAPGAERLMTAEARRKDAEDRIGIVLENATNKVLENLNNVVAPILEAGASRVEAIAKFLGIGVAEPIGPVGLASTVPEMIEAANQMRRAGENLMDIARDVMNRNRGGVAAPGRANPPRRGPI
jgi:hypothetical protein